MKPPIYDTKAVVRAERSHAAAELRGYHHLFQEAEGDNLQHAAFGRENNDSTEAKLGINSIGSTSLCQCLRIGGLQYLSGSPHAG